MERGIIVHRCPNCNSKVKTTSRFCPDCGIPIGINTEDISLSSEHVQENSKPALGIVTMIILFVVIIVIFLFIGSKGHTADNLEEITTAPTLVADVIAFPDDPAAISTASQSVVKLTCYDIAGELYATGSGFACFADNIIITNYHVISDGVYSIRVHTETGYTYWVDNILAIDTDRDIAILETKTKHNLDLLSLGETDSLEKGEKVVAIGSPLGLLNSVSTGIFSGYRNRNGMSILQFTAPISSGSSGGALFNSKGEVLGITFASYDDGQNLNLAIPAEYVKKLYESREETISVSDWFEANDGCYTYLLDSQTVEYGDLLENPEYYDETIVTVTGYAVFADENIISSDFTRNLMYLLPSKDHKTWDDEPSTVLFGKEFTGYSFYASEPFNETKMITCVDISNSLPTIRHIGESVTVTGWFDYDQDSRTADIKLLYIDE